ncbi:MAG: CotH kinase family protein [Clostridia bacterium]|nr:CotH kinase family protein [Clostridia bacterium]
MRKKVIRTTLLVALLIALLVPLTYLLSMGQGAIDANDAEHMVKPMLAMLAESPQMKANTAVEPMMELEDAWAVEDTREESWESPLVTGMRNGDNELGFDAQSNTFYCTLGMDGGDDWPELALFAKAAQGAENLRVAWIDDYSYDYRSDAIREGYRYELLAYTDTQYAYFGVVFTGLPTVTLHVHGGEAALGDEYVPARVSVSSAEHEAINSGVWVHLRGGGFVKEYPKWSYRMEFHEMTGRGDDKVERSVLGMPADTDWLLIGNGADGTCSRNELAWSLWRDWNSDGDAFMIQQSRMAEVFLDDEYVGIYQVMQRIDVEEEIVRMGGDLSTDYVARVIKPENLGEKPNADWTAETGFYGELRYAPQSVSAEAAFKRFDPYIRLSMPDRTLVSDEEFAALCEKHLDIREILEYFLYVQAASLGHDNYFNNVYMWALWDGSKYVYHLSPWDLDMAFIRMFGNGDEDTINLYYAQVWRMVDLDVGGSKQMLWDIWNEKRQTVISDDAMYTRIQSFEDMINRSGAYLRETEKWHGGAQELSLAEIQAFAVEHLHVADRLMSSLWPHEDAVHQE